MSYNKELETNREAKFQHDKNQMAAASRRLAEVAAKKRQKKLRNQE